MCERKYTLSKMIAINDPCYPGIRSALVIFFAVKEGKDMAASINQDSD